MQDKNRHCFGFTLDGLTIQSKNNALLAQVYYAKLEYEKDTEKCEDLNDHFSHDFLLLNSAIKNVFTMTGELLRHFDA